MFCEAGAHSRVWFFFFFSSRRRHTRCSRDWSSDVCSSDLAGVRAFGEMVDLLWKQGQLSGATRLEGFWNRSEERRVGKESRSRRGAEELKKKKGQCDGRDTINRSTNRMIYD